MSIQEAIEGLKILTGDVFPVSDDTLDAKQCKLMIEWLNSHRPQNSKLLGGGVYYGYAKEMASGIISLLAEAEKEQVCPRCKGEGIDRSDIHGKVYYGKNRSCPDCGGDGAYRSWVEKQITETLNAGTVWRNKAIDLKQQIADQRAEIERLADVLNKTVHILEIYRNSLKFDISPSFWEEIRFALTAVESAKEWLNGVSNGMATQ